MHAVGAQNRGDVDDRRVLRPGIAPVDAHFDGVVAEKENAVAFVDQGQEQVIGLGRQARAAEGQGMVLVQETLALVAGDEGGPGISGRNR
ncbi:hypothetical protein QW131_26945 [Roseibium salinum]|nr:hypothetical protein [Roseibium salinum]